MAVTVTAEEASRIISLKYPDLADGHEYEPWKMPLPQQQCPPPRTGKKRSLTTHPAVLRQRPRLGKRDHDDEDHDGANGALNFKSPQKSSNVELVYPSMYSMEDHLQYQDEDSFILSLTPLRADKFSSMMQDCAPGATPSGRKHKRPRLRRDSSTSFSPFTGGTGGGGIKRTYRRGGEPALLCNSRFCRFRKRSISLAAQKPRSKGAEHILRLCGASRSIFGKYTDIAR